jgi:hypothetical protein
MGFERHEMETLRELFIHNNVLSINGQELPLREADITWVQCLETFVSFYPQYSSLGPADIRKEYIKNQVFYHRLETLRHHQAANSVQLPTPLPAHAPAPGPSTAQAPVQVPSQAQTQVFNPDRAEYALSAGLQNYRPVQVPPQEQTQVLNPDRAEYAILAELQNRRPSQVAKPPRPQPSRDSAEYALQTSFEERSLPIRARVPSRAEFVVRDHADIISAEHDAAEFLEEVEANDAANILMRMNHHDAQLPMLRAAEESRRYEPNMI